MLDTALTHLAAGDKFAAIGALERHTDPQVVGDTYCDLILQLYWKQKDLPAVISMAWAGIHYCLQAAADAAEVQPEAAAKLKGAAKRIAYNLGSFCWPGWDEPGIHIDQTALYFGQEAARLDLRLALELERGDLALARAYWLLGAHLLAAGEGQAAESAFDDSVRHASAAKAKAEELLAQGFSLLTIWLANPTDYQTESALEDIRVQLIGEEDGDEYARQIETAGRVFQAGCPYK